MSRTPGNSDDDPAIPIVTESSGPTMPLADDAADVSLDVDAPEALAEAFERSPAADGALFARDAQAAGDAGEGRRADALVCARALLAERQGDDREADALWRSAFDRDPTLLVAFWGVRRALFRERAWEELLGVFARRIAAVFALDRQETRANLWLEHGRVLEDRLGRDADAAHSYRAGLIEVSDHPGLLISLLLMGWRRADAGMTAEALAGLLRRPLPPALRASLAVSLARLDRLDHVDRDVGASAVSVLGGGAAMEAAPAPVEPVAAARALETLRTALGQVGPGASRSLLAELVLLKRATADPGIRAEILGELVSHLEPGGGDDSGADPDGEVACALLRERARLMRHDLDDQLGAEQTLHQALARSPRHPIVIADLADLAEGTSGGRDAALARIRGLFDRVLPAEGPFETDAERELALRTLAALARAGRTSEGLTMLERHPELDRDRADVFVLEVMLRVAAGDVAGLAGAFERCGESLAREGRGGPRADGRDDAAAQLLVVAGALRECVDPPRSADVDATTEATRLYRRAVEIAPRYRSARDALERRLRNAGRNRDLANLWESELGHLRAEADPSDTARTQRSRLLEELVALYRDLLDDPVTASRYQDDLLAMDPVNPRGWVRRFDLQLATLYRGEPSNTDAKTQVLRELAERAGTAAVKAAALREAARAAVAGGDAVMAADLFTRGRADDRSGAASAGLERLATGSDKAHIVRAEMLASEAEPGERTAAQVARLRALRFRIAWHARTANEPREALEALEPLRAAGDALAWSWSWEIARCSGDPALEVAVLQAAPKGAGAALLRVSADGGAALERAGDLRGAEGAYRDALREESSTDAALGLLRVGSVLGNMAVILEAISHLSASADQATAPLLSQELAMLALLNDDAGAERVVRPLPAPPEGGAERGAEVVLRWAAGVRSGDVLGAAAGLLAIARTVPKTNTPEATADRNGLLARAAARARFGGTPLAGAVHDQVHALSGGTAPIGIGLSDLPVAGRPERAAARVARAERNGGRLAFALDMERALDAEARGDAAGALDGFARAVSRDPEGIEALDGIKRLARATGDRLGSARAGMRLGAVLRAPARAAAEFGMAGQVFEDLGMTPEGAVAYWQALAHDPGSGWLYERLRALLGGRGDDPGLDRLYGHRLAVLVEPRARAALLFERAGHRIVRMSDRKAAIEDFKRILKIDPDHRGALRQLATLALQMELFPQACRFLGRLLAHETDENGVASLRLELGDAYESARDLIRAVETFRVAAAARPRDEAPWQRLTDLFLRGGDWPSALGALRHWEAALGDPLRKAELWVRMGYLLRDHGRDGVGAAAAFVTASDLDPLGDGIRELVALHEGSGAIAARRDALDRAIVGLRHALATDPLDVPRLRRLRELYQLSGSSSGGDRDTLVAEGAIVAGQLLSLCGETVDLPPPRRGLPRGTFGAGFWSRLGHPGATGFAAEIWPMLAAAAVDLFPGSVVKPPHRERIPHGSEPRLAWVEAAATAVGLPTLELFFLKGGAPSNMSVIPVDGPQPALVLEAGVLSGNSAVRFRVGRALSLLRDGGVVLERLTASEWEALFAAAAVVAGATPPAVPDLAKVEEGAKQLAKAMSRRDRKALELEASRFGFEAMDAALFREAIFTNADRLGLILAGDVKVAVRGVGHLDDDAPPATVVADRGALALIRFALHDDYLALRRQVDEGEV